MHYNQGFPCILLLWKTVRISYTWLSFSNKILHSNIVNKTNLFKSYSIILRITDNEGFFFYQIHLKTGKSCYFTRKQEKSVTVQQWNYAKLYYLGEYYFHWFCSLRHITRLSFPSPIPTLVREWSLTVNISWVSYFSLEFDLFFLWLIYSLHWCWNMLQLGV